MPLFSTYYCVYCECICIHVCVCVCVCVYVCVCMHVCSYICDMRVSVSACLCMHAMNMCVHLYFVHMCVLCVDGSMYINYVCVYMHVQHKLVRICDWLWENPSLTHLVIFQEIPFQNILPIQTPYRQ